MESHKDRPVIDLTRLMFDDGAERKPIDTSTLKTVFLSPKGERIAWRIVDPRELIGQDNQFLCGMHLYAEDCLPTSTYNIRVFKDNPGRYMQRMFGDAWTEWTYLPMNSTSYKEVQSGQLVFVHLENLDA